MLTSLSAVCPQELRAKSKTRSPTWSGIPNSK